MKRIGMLIATLAMVGAIGACTEPEPEPAKTETVTASPEETFSPDTGSGNLSRDEAEDVFVQTLRNEISTLSDNDQDLINMGDAVCESFDAGNDIYSTAEAIQSGGFTEYQSGFIIGASVSALCDEHMNKIEVEESY